MSKTKPVYIMNEQGISDLEKKAILDGTKELLKIASVEGIISITDFGAWKGKDYKNPDGSLARFQSVDWYLQEGKKFSREHIQLNAEELFTYLEIEPWRKTKDHYDILATKQDMYYKDTNFVIGIAYPCIGTVVSTYRFKNLPDKTKYECIKTEIMHELGHAFGLVRTGRENSEYNLGQHCTNKCVMRQGLRLPTDWINMTNDRLKHGALCSLCEKDLKEWFKETPGTTNGKPKILNYSSRSKK